MSNKKSNVVTGLRVLGMVILLALMYRHDKIEVFFTAITLVAICFWVFPYCLTNLVFYIFKIKDDFGGVLQYDDTDPTDCKFRMLFNFDPEDLAKEPTFVVKTERTSLNVPNVIPRDGNND